MKKMQAWSMFISGFAGANLLNKFISGLNQGFTILQVVYLIGVTASFLTGYALLSKIK